MTAVILRCDCIECEIAVTLVANGKNAIAATVAHSQVVQGRRSAEDVEVRLVIVTAALNGDVAQAGTIAAGVDSAVADLQAAPIAAGVADGGREGDGLRGRTYGRNGAVHEQGERLVEAHLHALCHSQGDAISYGHIANNAVGVYPVIPLNVPGDVAAKPFNLVAGVAAPDVVLQLGVGWQPRRHPVAGDTVVAQCQIGI